MKPYAYSIEKEVSPRDHVLLCNMVDPRGFAITLVIRKEEFLKKTVISCINIFEALNKVDFDLSIKSRFNKKLRL